MCCHSLKNCCCNKTSRTSVRLFIRQFYFRALTSFSFWIFKIFLNSLIPKLFFLNIRNVVCMQNFVPNGSDLVLGVVEIKNHRFHSIFPCNVNLYLIANLKYHNTFCICGNILIGFNQLYACDTETGIFQQRFQFLG